MRSKCIAMAIYCFNAAQHEKTRRKHNCMVQSWEWLFEAALKGEL